MSTDTIAPSQTEAPVGKIIEKYIQLRDRKAELKKEYEKKVEAIDSGLERCEAFLLNLLNRQGVEAFKASEGTAYISVKSTASVADREAFLNHVRESGEWSMLDVRANKTTVEEYRQANGDNPPGVNWSSMRTVNVRRN